MGGIYQIWSQLNENRSIPLYMSTKQCLNYHITPIQDKSFIKVLLIGWKWSRVAVFQIHFPEREFGNFNNNSYACEGFLHGMLKLLRLLLVGLGYLSFQRMSTSRYRTSLRTSLLQDQLYDTLRFRQMRPDLLNFQPRAIHHLVPLTLRALGRYQTDHHSQIYLGCNQATALVGENELIEDNFGIAWRHCWRELREYDLAFVVGPVVEDVAQIISTSAWLID